MTEQPWYVLKVKSRYERAIQSRLQGKGFEAIVPVQPQLRRWSDRIKKVETVLFNGYVFISSTPYNLHGIHFEGGILGFVRFENKLAELREPDIRLIKNLTNFETPVTILHSRLLPGEQVEITEGPLRGYFGVVEAHKGGRRILISIPGLHCVARVETGIESIRKIS